MLLLRWGVFEGRETGDLPNREIGSTTMKKAAQGAISARCNRVITQYGENDLADIPNKRVPGLRPRIKGTDHTRVPGSCEPIKAIMARATGAMPQSAHSNGVAIRRNGIPRMRRWIGRSEAQVRDPLQYLAPGGFQPAFLRCYQSWLSSAAVSGTALKSRPVPRNGYSSRRHRADTYKEQWRACCDTVRRHCSCLMGICPPCGCTTTSGQQYAI